MVKTADQKRKAFKTVTVEKVPRRRRWRRLHDMCAICLNSDDTSVPNARVVCFGKKQCDHTFHIACIDKWLLRSETCPLCRDSGGRVAKVELDDGRDVVLSSLLAEPDDIPTVELLRGFFELAKLKINKINFLRRRRRHKVTIEVCGPGCRSKKCSHQITSVAEMLGWFMKMPPSLKHPRLTMGYLAKRVLRPKLIRLAPEVYDHLLTLCADTTNLPKYEYNEVHH